MALYHKWSVKTGFTFVLQFFMLISDGLGGVLCRGVINGKAGKAAALPKFSDTLVILSQLGRGADYAHILMLPCLKKFRDYASEFLLFNEKK